MVQKHEAKVGVVTLVGDAKNEAKKNEKNIPENLFREFISRHQLTRLWEEFLYEKEHPKIPLSASDVLAMINLSPEEQEKIIKEHE